MTAQFCDTVNYRGQDYSIAGTNGTGLFDPNQHGIEPVGRCTACWRGFLCAYYVDTQRLLLDELRVNLDGSAPMLFGIDPKPGIVSISGFELRTWDAIYKQLRHPVSYAGGLLLARDFIYELYVHMGFHPAWKYREVHELVFRDGELVRETDRSDQIAELRREIADRPLEPGHGAKREEIERWVEKCFSQGYTW